MLPYFDKIYALLDDAESKHAPTIEKVGQAIAESIAAGGILHVFGTGHSHMLAEELFYRAGGFVPVNAILDTTLMLHESALGSSLAEKLPGYAEVVLARYRVEAGETMIIASNSGRNSVPVEMALAAKARGLTVVALTSLAHATAQPSRHPSGKHLHDLADYVLDNCGVVGDASLTVEGVSEAIAPTSTVVGVALLHSVMVAVTKYLAQKGVEPPIFISANVNGAEEHNQRLIERYRERLRHL